MLQVQPVQSRPLRNNGAGATARVGCVRFLLRKNQRSQAGPIRSLKLTYVFGFNGKRPAGGIS